MKDLNPAETPSLPNAAAIDRALHLCSITQGGEPFHMKLAISPPKQSRGNFQAAAMAAQIEIWWLNPITYRTEIRSATFQQTRIVNGNVVDERNLGAFYPRWLQNFVDAVFDPAPRASRLRRQPGSIPLSLETHACISTPGVTPEESAQMCFEGAQPLLASGVDFTRYVGFDDFRAFGSQLIPRSLTNDLPANLLVPGRVLLLEPMPQSAYPLLKALRFTPLKEQIQTRLVSRAEAESLLTENSLATLAMERLGRSSTATQPISYPPSSPQPAELATIYIRTDRTGRVREAYTDGSDVYGLHKAAAARALNLRFNPLLVNGAAVQMEAPLQMR